MSTETNAESNAETPDLETGATLVEDPDALETPIALGIKVDVVAGERRVGLSGVPNLGAAVHYVDLLAILDAMDVEGRIDDASGEVGTFYYDTEADAAACELTVQPSR